MRLIGFSSGTLFQHVSPVSAEAFKLFKRIGCDFLELACVFELTEKRLDALLQLDRGALKKFKAVSIHAPAEASYNDNAASRKTLSKLEAACKKFATRYVVFHPDAIKEPEVVLEYDLPAAVENMDKLKNFDQTADELAPFISWGFKFVLDVNHALTNDPSFCLAHELKAAFRDKICGVHLSGYQNGHDLIHKTRQMKLMEILTDVDAPIAIESMCADEAEAKRELEFVKSFFKQQT